MNKGPLSGKNNANFYLPGEEINIRRDDMFAEWNDRVGNGITQQDVHYRTFPALQVMSDKLWRGTNVKNVPFAEFDALCKRMPEAPGVNLLAKVKDTFGK